MASEIKVDTIVNAGGDNDSGIDLATNDTIKLKIAGSEKARMDDGGDIIIGKTAQNNTAVGTVLQNDGFASFVRDGNLCVILNRLTDDGTITDFRKDGTTCGYIGTGNSGDLYIGNDDTGIMFAGGSDAILPTNNATLRDNAIQLGLSNYRFDDAFITNGVTTGSDEREKQQIASLTDAEITAAKAISKLFKTFKWNDAVIEKGDNARIHTGVMAQQVQTAMSDAGLDASKYAFWCSDTYWEKDNITYNTEEEAPKDASKITRLSLRYVELLAFIGAATEQRLASIEARLTALESK